MSYTPPVRIDRDAPALSAKKVPDPPGPPGLINIEPILLSSAAGYILRKISAVSFLRGSSQLRGTTRDEQKRAGLSAHGTHSRVALGDRLMPLSSCWWEWQGPR